MQLYVAIPTHDDRVHQECMKGVLSANKIVRILDVCTGSSLKHNRDVLTLRFLQSKCTHMLCLDSDIGWRVENVAALLALDVPFAFGRYSMKDGSERVVAGGLEPHPRQDAPCQTALWCGAGFVLLSRAAVEQMMVIYHDSELYLDGDQKLVGLWQGPGWVNKNGVRVKETEDAAFCRRWRAIGGEIVTRTDFVLPHYGSAKYEPRT